VAALVRERFGTDWQRANLVVVGDFNDQPASPFVHPLVGMGLVNVVERLPPGERWTHYWDKKNSVSQLDYILLTKRLAQASPKVPYIERRGLVRKRKMPGPAALFAGVTSRIGASDHCPVVMEIVVK